MTKPDHPTLCRKGFPKAKQNTIALNSTQELYDVYAMFKENRYPIMRRIALANRAKAVVTYDRVLNQEVRA